ncbi:MAG: TatD family hydrolase [Syntrophomonadaceae bacterium]|jgi:TatD DNase family protein|nr:TatD family hydrolase [Syntrophomonadaceae bacterium]
MTVQEHFEPLIDSHAHLQDRAFASDLPQVMQRAQAANIGKIICIGYDYDTSVEAVSLAHQYQQVYAVVGVHPHDAKTLNADIISKLYALARDPRVVAIGETGLDYYRDLSPRDIQRQAFVEQIKIAAELNKPIVIHDRDAHQEVLDIIKKEKAGRNQGVMHCYSGHLPLAIELMKEGFYISFAGPLTYKNARKTVEVASRITLDRILIETDCPYLTPEPLRGKRNEPAHVVYVAQKLAQLRQKSLAEIAYQTSLNACRVFNLPQS